MPLSTANTVEEAEALLALAPSPVIFVAVRDAYDDGVRCLEAILAHTSPQVAVFIIDDGGIDGRLGARLEEVSDRLTHHVVLLRRQTSQGFVRSCNDAFAVTRCRDVVIVNSDVIVGPEWLDRLAAAALSMDTIATATSLTNHGAIVSVPFRNTSVRSLPDGMSTDEAARRVAVGSYRLRPPIPTAVGHCCYIRRQALDLVGPFDTAFDPGYGEEVDFSQRALSLGFRHVVADDVFTFHRGSASFGNAPEVIEIRADHEDLVRVRYPWYESMMMNAAQDPASPLADAIGAARRALIGMSVGIDALMLGPHKMGTQQIIVETVRALAGRDEITRLVVFTPLHRYPYVESLSRELPDVEFIGVNPSAGVPDRVVDLLYRPCQVNDLAELSLLARSGERFVVNQLDSIAFENPAYFESPQRWAEYRDVTRLTMQLANGVAFLSQRSYDAVRAEGLLGSDTPWSVVSCGVGDEALDDDGARPCELGPSDAPYLLCLGATYAHKNRRFALEAWAELRRRGWTGRLVLAGPTPPSGGSQAREAEFLLGAAELRSDVVSLGAVTEEEKRWLYRHAALVLYPSSIEGFGLVPFEAAQHGVATLSSRLGSLEEILPKDIEVLDGFDVSRAADSAWRLLHDRSACDEIVNALLEHGRQFTWERTADRLIDLFDQALQQPRGRVLAIEGEGYEPIGLVARSHRERPSEKRFEHFIRAVITHPNLKGHLSPEGSARQRAARNVINGVRRRLH